MCSQCVETIESMDHKLKCNVCINRMNVCKRYILDLNNLLEKHIIDQATTIVFIHCTKKWLYNETMCPFKEFVPDASTTLNSI
jgi:hypothetical protein